MLVDLLAFGTKSNAEHLSDSVLVKSQFLHSASTGRSPVNEDSFEADFRVYFRSGYNKIKT